MSKCMNQRLILITLESDEFPYSQSDMYLAEVCVCVGLIV